MFLFLWIKFTLDAVFLTVKLKIVLRVAIYGSLLSYGRCPFTYLIRSVNCVYILV
ncbi:hypothetical protein Fmac_009399 [Flemingia macrophylla]|uniref:Photosystem II protein I n=1 Tax=Flemingia macrophylla TaxID=520843 RepID=A0ABD1N077_9FABA